MRTKSFFCLLFACSCFFAGMAQQQPFNCDSNQYQVFRMNKGQKLDVKCDTIYVLNRYTFNWLFEAYNDYRNQNSLLNQYTLRNDSITGMYDQQLEAQRLYFDTLNSYFNQLSQSADDLIRKSTTNIDSISGNLDSIASQVQQAKENINNASKNITEAKKHIARNKFKWTAIGFGAGVVLTLVGTLF